MGPVHVKVVRKGLNSSLEFGIKSRQVGVAAVTVAIKKKKQDTTCEVVYDHLPTPRPAIHFYINNKHM